MIGLGRGDGNDDVDPRAGRANGETAPISLAEKELLKTVNQQLERYLGPELWNKINGLSAQEWNSLKDKPGDDFFKIIGQKVNPESAINKVLLAYLEFQTEDQYTLKKSLFRQQKFEGSPRQQKLQDIIQLTKAAEKAAPAGNLEGDPKVVTQKLVDILIKSKGRIEFGGLESAALPEAALEGFAAYILSDYLKKIPVSNNSFKFKEHVQPRIELVQQFLDWDKKGIILGKLLGYFSTTQADEVYDKTYPDRIFTTKDTPAYSAIRESKTVLYLVLKSLIKPAQGSGLDGPLSILTWDTKRSSEMTDSQVDLYRGPVLQSIGSLTSENPNFAQLSQVLINNPELLDSILKNADPAVGQVFVDAIAKNPDWSLLKDIIEQRKMPKSPALLKSVAVNLEGDAKHLETLAQFVESNPGPEAQNFVAKVVAEWCLLPGNLDQAKVFLSRLSQGGSAGGESELGKLQAWFFTKAGWENGGDSTKALLARLFKDSTSQDELKTWAKNLKTSHNLSSKGAALLVEQLGEGFTKKPGNANFDKAPSVDVFCELLSEQMQQNPEADPNLIAAMIKLKKNLTQASPNKLLDNQICESVNKMYAQLALANQAAWLEQVTAQLKLEGKQLQNAASDSNFLADAGTAYRDWQADFRRRYFAIPDLLKLASQDESQASSVELISDTLPTLIKTQEISLVELLYKVDQSDLGAVGKKSNLYPVIQADLALFLDRRRSDGGNPSSVKALYEQMKPMLLATEFDEDMLDAIRKLGSEIGIVLQPKNDQPVNSDERYNPAVEILYLISEKNKKREKVADLQEATIDALVDDREAKHTRLRKMPVTIIGVKNEGPLRGSLMDALPGTNDKVLYQERPGLHHVLNQVIAPDLNLHIGLSNVGDITELFNLKNLGNAKDFSSLVKLFGSVPTPSGEAAASTEQSRSSAAADIYQMLMTDFTFGINSNNNKYDTITTRSIGDLFDQIPKKIGREKIYLPQDLPQKIDSLIAKLQSLKPTTQDQSPQPDISPQLASIISNLQSAKELFADLSAENTPRVDWRSQPLSQDSATEIVDARADSGKSAAMNKLKTALSKISYLCRYGLLYDLAPAEVQQHFELDDAGDKAGIDLKNVRNLYRVLLKTHHKNKPLDGMDPWRIYSFPSAKTEWHTDAARPAQLAQENVANLRKNFDQAWATEQPINLKLMPGQLYILTGRNGGGKTTALSTIGETIMSQQVGITVNGENKSAPVVINAVIGASVSVQGENRSSFQNESHSLADAIRRLKELPRGQTGVLICDEINTGTSPFEGAALAMAELEWCLENNVIVIVSSHFAKELILAAKVAGQEKLLKFLTPDPETHQILEVAEQVASSGVEVTKILIDKYSPHYGAESTEFLNEFASLALSIRNKTSQGGRVNITSLPVAELSRRSEVNRAKTVEFADQKSRSEMGIGDASAESVTNRIADQVWSMVLSVEDTKLLSGLGVESNRTRATFGQMTEEGFKLSDPETIRAQKDKIQSALQVKDKVSSQKFGFYVQLMERYYSDYFGDKIRGSLPEGKSSRASAFAELATFADQLADQNFPGRDGFSKDNLVLAQGGIEEAVVQAQAPEKLFAAYLYTCLDSRSSDVQYQLEQIKKRLTTAGASAEQIEAIFTKNQSLDSLMTLVAALAKNPAVKTSLSEITADSAIQSDNLIQSTSLEYTWTQYRSENADVKTAVVNLNTSINQIAFPLISAVAIDQLNMTKVTTAGMTLALTNAMPIHLLKTDQFSGLDREKLVGQTLLIEDQTVVAGLEGLNGGGKTTTLKTIGANLEMARYMGYSASESAVVPDYQFVKVSINAGISGAEGSSFQNEIRQYLDLLSWWQNAGFPENGVILIDEPLKSTSTADQRALLTAMILLFKQRNVRVVMTTHDPEINDLLESLDVKTQEYYYGDEAAEGAETDAKISSKFALRTGRSQGSNPFEAASRQGMPPEIISRAEEIVRLMKQNLATTRVEAAA